MIVMGIVMGIVIVMGIEMGIVIGVGMTIKGLRIWEKPFRREDPKRCAPLLERCSRVSPSTLSGRPQNRP